MQITELPVIDVTEPLPLVQSVNLETIDDPIPCAATVTTSQGTLLAYDGYGRLVLAVRDGSTSIAGPHVDPADLPDPPEYPVGRVVVDNGESIDLHGEAIVEIYPDPLLVLHLPGSVRFQIRDWSHVEITYPDRQEG